MINGLQLQTDFPPSMNVRETVIKITRVINAGLINEMVMDRNLVIKYLRNGPFSAAWNNSDFKVDLLGFF